MVTLYEAITEYNQILLLSKTFSINFVQITILATVAMVTVYAIIKAKSEILLILKVVV